MQIRSVAKAIAFSLCAVVAGGCGGGGSSGGGNQAEPCPPAATSAQAANSSTQSGSEANRVVLSGGAGTQGQGRFSDVGTAPLARSGKALLSAGSGAERYRFSAAGLQGYYRLYAWWPQQAGASEKVVASIQHAEGASQRQLDQRSAAGQWNLLGLYRFAASEAALIELSAPAGQSFLADAVRFEYVGALAPALSLRTSALPAALSQHAYRVVLEAESGRAPYSWSVMSGALAPGLSLDAQSGRISGTASASGVYAVGLRVSDAQGAYDSRVFELRVFSEPAAAAAGAKLAKAADGAPKGAAPSLSELLNLVAAAPEGSWIKANLNLFSDVFTPLELRPFVSPSNPSSPAAIIAAWSSFAWDPNRGDLWLFGGGHANYAGNEVYRWRGSTRRWERASLPSEVKQDDLGNFMAIDGYDAAPSAAHTYDNNMFLPLIDRFVSFGGAAHANGNMWLRQASATSSRPTGPYFFDPNRADANKVGGSTGSHVKRVAPHPEIVGGNMWTNRDIFGNIPGNPPLPARGSFLEGCTAYDQQNGKDVVYSTVGVYLYKYTINDLANPAADTWEVVGRPPLTLPPLVHQAACGYDALMKLFVRRGVRGTPAEEPQAKIPFTYWDLNSAGENNIEVRLYPSDPGGQFTAFINQPLPSNLTSTKDWLATCGMDFDPLRRKWVLWCGDGVVWWLTPPASVSPNGWVISKQPSAASAALPDGDYGTGINGKWKYIPNLDAYMGLINQLAGNVWIYKPVGWQTPSNSPEPTVGGNQAPSVVLMQPAADLTLSSPATIELIAEANDPDGTIVKVEFFQDTTKLGESDSAPHSLLWNAPLGTHKLSVVATDNAGAQSASAPVTLQVGSSLSCPN